MMISASLISKYRQALATLGDSVQVTLANTYADAVARGLVESEIRDLLAEAAWSATSNLGTCIDHTATVPLDPMSDRSVRISCTS